MAASAVSGHPGRGDDEGHAGAHLEKRSGLRPFALLAKLVAMVGDEDDDRVVPQSLLVEAATILPTCSSRLVIIAE